MRRRVQIFRIAVGVAILLRCSAQQLNEPGSSAEVLDIGDPTSDLADRDWKSFQAVELGSSYAIVMQTKLAEGFQAEYYKRVFVFGGTAKKSRFLRAFQLDMNTGGHNHILLYRFVDSAGKPLVFLLKDIYGEVLIDLKMLSFTHLQVDRGVLKKEFLGTFSDNTRPSKFVPSVVLGEKEALDALH